MREAEFQAKVIKEIRKDFPEAIVIKNDARYLQGVPDFTVLYKSIWVFLEFKKSKTASYRPNQEYYLDIADRWSHQLTVYPENWQESKLYLWAVLKDAE